MNEDMGEETATPLRALIIEDSEDDLMLLLRELQRGGYDTVYRRVDSADAMQEALRHQEWDLVISDYVMPRFSGMAALDILSKSGFDLPFIIVSGKIGEDTAVAALKAGAHDYILKGSLVRLLPAIERELKDAALRKEQQRAERKLREQASILDSFFSDTITPLVLLDKDFNFIRVNNAYARACGKEVSEFTGHNHFTFYPHAENEEIFRRVVETKTPYRAFAKPFSYPDHPEWGTSFWDWTLTPILDNRGDVDFLVFSLSDVTEKTRLQSIAEAVNTINNIGYVFAGIRHEIGNPVNSAKITLSVLRANLDRYSREDLLEYLERIAGELSRVEYLLRALKNYNLYELPELQHVDMRAFIEKFISLAKDDCSKQGVALRSDVDRDVDSVYADPRALHQVLLNILTNALDACAGLSERTIGISVRNAPDMVLIEVTDTGRGMSDEQSRDLFKPFYTTKPNGTGLGLVITRKVLSRMNGTISISSRTGEGTRVEILLPRGAAGHA